MNRSPFVFLVFAAMFRIACPAHAETRQALVIGNSAYQNVTRLKNPVGDAALIAGVLEKAGFQVDKHENLTAAALREALRTFRTKLTDQSVAVVYYSGHGVQLNGENYLLPVDLSAKFGYEVEEQGLALNTIVKALEGANVPLKVLFLDCCRDTGDLLPGEKKSLSRGLGEVKLEHDDTLVCFATKHGMTASDDNDRANSNYTAAVAETILTPGLTLELAMKEVARKVVKASGGTQRPFTYGSLLRDFSFITGGSQPIESKMTPTVPDMSKAEVQRRVEEELRKRVVPNAPPSSPESALGSVLDSGGIGKAIQVKFPGNVLIKSPGDVLMKFSYCPPGSFTMGSSKSENGHLDDEDQVEVRISKGFWMAQTECTQAQWTAMMGWSSRSDEKGDDFPVESMSWDEVQTLIAKLNKDHILHANWKWSLPTEAQWEYACRAGTKTPFAYGDSLVARQANFRSDQPYGSAQKTESYIGKTIAVASYEANGWRLYDMHGNVDEWCLDKFERYAALPGGTDPVGESGSFRVYRGGDYSASGSHCRSANRTWEERSSYWSRGIGFRLALVPSR